MSRDRKRSSTTGRRTGRRRMIAKPGSCSNCPSSPAGVSHGVLPRHAATGVASLLAADSLSIGGRSTVTAGEDNHKTSCRLIPASGSCESAVTVGASPDSCGSKGVVGPVCCPHPSRKSYNGLTLSRLVWVFGHDQVNSGVASCLVVDEL